MQENQALAPRPAADALPRDVSTDLSAELPIRFTGSGSEYFRIWIVNLLLSILTLGIYSAWAKVRRLKYFYGNTLIDGAPLDYHGTPIAILKGRIVAAVLLAIWMGVQQFGSLELIGGVFLVGLAILPLLLVRSLRFQYFNTSYRGVRFGFGGTTLRAYMVFLLWPLLLFPGVALSFVSIYLIPVVILVVPFAHQQLRKYLHDGVRYGNLPGSMHAGVGAFYLIYLFTVLIVIGALVGAGLVVAAIPGLVRSVNATVASLGGDIGLGAGVLALMVAIALGAMLIFVLIAGPFFVVRIRNLVWNRSRLGEHQFRSRAKVLPFIWIAVSNFVLIVCTFGLFTPAAQIRKARYLIQTMALVPKGSLDEVVAVQQDRVNAVGQETADLFDIDVAL
ncbi:DUF898 domain-containing protein [Pigmentiphaga aceris]|uniref:DUF898 domain-containing protein n=1 Tax=Pigmentiphaga aceris TaxID=1940612 RepID=A0A5C0AS76_9BURK|nr:YjgN family protein [Pigmentiphaga aceris]QEI05018.1 DUF898 domain-containing protein [Pigmentiphaga aceris]